MIVNGTITVNKNTKTTLTMDNLVKYFNGPQKLMAKLVDGFGNPIANATVYFTINGKVYARITDENGTASIAIRLLIMNTKQVHYLMELMIMIWRLLMLVC